MTICLLPWEKKPVQNGERILLLEKPMFPLTQGTRTFVQRLPNVFQMSMTFGTRWVVVVKTSLVHWERFDPNKKGGIIGKGAALKVQTHPR